MQKFLLRSIAFFIAIVAVFAGMTFTMPKDTNNYLCMLDKKDSLLLATPSPRYIFLSGSSFAFGLDSKMLHDSLGVNVVNAGLHAGLGLKYIIESAIPYIRQGDTVVISLEYEHLCNQMYGDAVTLGPAMYYTNFKNIGKLNIQQFLRAISGYPTALRMNKISLKENKNNVTYVKSSFNEFGDEEAHRDTIPVARIFKEPAYDKHLKKDSYGTSFLHCLQNISDKGATIVIIPSPMRRGAYNKILGTEVTTFLNENNYSFLVPHEEHLFPDSLMYDTDYHLSGEGVNIFTKKLIKELKQYRQCSAS